MEDPKEVINNALKRLSVWGIEHPDASIDILGRLRDIFTEHKSGKAEFLKIRSDYPDLVRYPKTKAAIWDLIAISAGTNPSLFNLSTKNKDPDEMLEYWCQIADFCTKEVVKTLEKMQTNRNN